MNQLNWGHIVNNNKIFCCMRIYLYVTISLISSATFAQSFALSAEYGTEKRSLEHNISSITDDLIAVAYSLPRNGSIYRFAGIYNFDDRYSVSLSTSFHDRYSVSYIFRDFDRGPEEFRPVKKVVAMGGKTMDIGAGVQRKIQLFPKASLELGLSAGVLFYNRKTSKVPNDLGSYSDRILDVWELILAGNHKNQAFIRPSASIFYRSFFLRYSFQQSLLSPDFVSFNYGGNKVDIDYRENFNQFSAGFRYTIGK